MEISEIEYRTAKEVVGEIVDRRGKNIDKVITELEERLNSKKDVDDLMRGDYARMIIRLYENGNQEESGRDRRKLYSERGQTGLL